MFLVGDDSGSALEAWRHSQPSYAAAYYSDNSGVALLLQCDDAQQTAADAEGPVAAQPLSVLHTRSGEPDGDPERTSRAGWR